jgi:DNA-binding MarR family transcriptional regulator
MARQKHSPEQQQILCDFILRVSPEADPANIRLFGLLMETRTQLVQATEKRLAAAGLTWAKLRLLMHLAKQEYLAGSSGVQPSELSEMQDISRNTVSALINGLEAEGLVTRELHGRDRRKYVIRLTPGGREMLRARLGNHLKFVSQCFDSFNLSERDLLLDLLVRLNTNLEERVE